MFFSEAKHLAERAYDAAVKAAHDTDTHLKECALRYNEMKCQLDGINGTLRWVARGIITCLVVVVGWLLTQVVHIRLS